MTGNLVVSAPAPMKVVAVAQQGARGPQGIQGPQGPSEYGYATLAALNADLSRADGSIALVTNDPTLENNCFWRKSGSAGSGSWVAAVDRVAKVEARTNTTAIAWVADGVNKECYPLRLNPGDTQLARTDGLGRQILSVTNRTSRLGNGCSIQASTWTKGAVTAVGGVMTETTATGLHRADANLSSIADDETLVLRAVLSSSNRMAYMRLRGKTVADFGVTFNLVDGTVAGQPINTTRGVDYDIQPAGSGRWFCWVKKNLGIGNTVGNWATCQLRIVNPAFGWSDQYAGDGVSTLTVHAADVVLASEVGAMLPAPGAAPFTAPDYTVGSDGKVTLTTPPDEGATLAWVPTSFAPASGIPQAAVAGLPADIARVGVLEPKVSTLETRAKGTAIEWTADGVQSTIYPLKVNKADTTLQKTCFLGTVALSLVARSNFIDYSWNLASAHWSKTGVTPSAGVSDPKGGTRAFTVTETTANSAHSISIVNGSVTPPPGDYEIPVIIRPNGRTKIIIRGFAQNCFCIFDLTGAGAYQGLFAGSAPISQSIQPLANGYYLIRVKGTLASGNPTLTIYSWDGISVSVTYTGSGAPAFDFYEAGYYDIFGDLIPTNGAMASRADYSIASDGGVVLSSVPDAGDVLGWFPEHIKAASVQGLAALVTSLAPAVSDVWQDARGNVEPILPSPALVCWGDSLTAATYPSALAAKFTPNRTLTNNGIGGETSTQILARQKGHDINLTGITWTPGTIRLKTQRAVPPRSIDTGYRTSWVGIGAAIAEPRYVEFFNDGVLIGTSWDQLQSACTISGTRLSAAGHPWANGDQVYFLSSTASGMYVGKVYFVRDSDGTGFSVAEVSGGSAISFGAGSATALGGFYFDWAYGGGTHNITTITHTDKDTSTLILWMGANNITAVSQVKADIQAAFTHAKTLAKRIIVLTCIPNETWTTGTDGFNARATINAWILKTFPANSVDVYAYLRTKGDGGANDNADIAAGIIPRSLRVDAIHLTSAGYGHVATCVAVAMTAKNW